MSDVDSNVNASLKYIARGAGWLFIGAVISKILAYGFRAFIARTLSVSDYGIFNLAVMVTTLAAYIAGLGLTSGLPRYIPYFRARNNSTSVCNTLKFVIKFTTISSILAAALVYIFSNQISYWFNGSIELSALLKYLSFHIPFSVVGFSIILSCLLYFGKTKIYSILFNVVMNIIRLGGAMVFVLLGFGIAGVGISYVLSFIIVTILAFYFLSRTFPIFKTDCKGANEFDALDFVNYSWPLLFIVIISLINGWIDSFMIGHMMTVADVGIYNGALPIAQLMMFAPNLITPLFLPLISRHFAKNEHSEIKTISKQVFKWILAANFFIFLVMFAFPGALINFLFGGNYLAGTQTLLILSFGYLALSLSAPFGQLLELHKKTKLILANVLVIITINILLNYFWIPAYGINGAAIATTISNCLLTLLIFAENYVITKVGALSLANIKIALAGILPFLGLLIVRWLTKQHLLTLIVSCMVTFGIYCWMLLKLKVVDEKDKDMLKLIEQKTNFKFLRTVYNFIK